MVRNALTMMVGTLASRVLGLLREVITAALFGASRSLDAFFVAYTLANLARQLLAEGALSAAFVPVFSRVLSDQGKDRARELARQALTVLSLVTLVVVLLGIWLSPQLVQIMAPGFDAGKQALAVTMTRQMFPFLLLVSLAALVMGVLNSLDCFFVPALAPALSNGIYILIAFALAPSWGVNGLVWAVMAGGAVQLLFQWGWAAGPMAMALTPKIPRGDPDLRRMMALFLPYAAGLSLNQLNPVLSRLLGSFLPDGSISVLTYANRVIQLPLGLVVIAISQAVLPELSRSLSQSEGAFQQILRDAMRFALFLILPVTVGSLVLSSEAVHFLFFRGAFDGAASRGTAAALFYSSLGLPGMACSTVVMRALYAKELSRQAMVTTASSVAATLVLSLALIGPMGLRGLALGGSLAFSLSSWVGLRLLQRSMKTPLGLFSRRWLVKMGLSLALLAGACGALKALWSYPAGAGMALRSLWLGSQCLVGAAVFFSASILLRCEEWSLIAGALRQRSAKPSEKGEKR